MIRLSHNIRLYRGIYKCTQLDLANELNVSRTAITVGKVMKVLPTLTL